MCTVFGTFRGCLVTVKKAIDATHRCCQHLPSPHPRLVSISSFCITQPRFTMATLTPQDVTDAAEYFGVDLVREPYLLWILREVSALFFAFIPLSGHL